MAGRTAPAARGRLAVTRSNSDDLYSMGTKVRGGRKPQQTAIRRQNSVKFSARNFMSHQKGAKIEDFYAIDNAEILGEGAFGEVMSCTHIQSGEARAVKRLEKDPRHEEFNDEVIREFKILRKLDHPNLLKVYDLFEDDKEFYIVTDIYSGGDLFDYLEEVGNLPEEHAAVVVNSLLVCLNYLHASCNMTHLDLKLENVLLDENKALEDLKIIDFGLCKVFDEGDTFSELVGTPTYVSPQILEGSYTYKADIWACGVIAYTLLAGFTPFDGPTEGCTMQNVLVGSLDFEDQVWKSVSDLAKDFVSQLLEYEEDKRPTAQKALSHPWLEQLRSGTFVKPIDATAIRKTRPATRDALVGLANFSSSQSKLKQAVCALLCSQLVQKREKSFINDDFRLIDHSLTGAITKEDLYKSYNKEGFRVDAEAIDSIFEEVNFSGTGIISYSEFAIVMMLEKNMVGDDKLQHAFDLLDVTDDGELTLNDLKQALALDDNAAEKMMRQIDSNGNGVISFDEFKDAILEKDEEFITRRLSIFTETTETESESEDEESASIRDGDDDNDDNDYNNEKEDHEHDVTRCNDQSADEEAFSGGEHSITGGSGPVTGPSDAPVAEKNIASEAQVVLVENIESEIEACVLGGVEEKVTQSSSAQKETMESKINEKMPEPVISSEQMDISETQSAGTETGPDVVDETSVELWSTSANDIVQAHPEISADAKSVGETQTTCIENTTMEPSLETAVAHAVNEVSQQSPAGAAKCFESSNIEIQLTADTEPERVVQTVPEESPAVAAIQALPNDVVGEALIKADAADVPVNNQPTPEHAETRSVEASDKEPEILKVQPTASQEGEGMTEAMNHGDEGSTSQVQPADHVAVSTVPALSALPGVPTQEHSSTQQISGDDEEHASIGDNKQHIVTEKAELAIGGGSAPQSEFDIVQTLAKVGEGEKIEPESYNVVPESDPEATKEVKREKKSVKKDSSKKDTKSSDKSRRSSDKKSSRSSTKKSSEIIDKNASKKGNKRVEISEERSKALQLRLVKSGVKPDFNWSSALAGSGSRQTKALRLRPVKSRNKQSIFSVSKTPDFDWTTKSASSKETAVSGAVSASLPAQTTTETQSPTKPNKLGLSSSLHDHSSRRESSSRRSSRHLSSSSHTSRNLSSSAHGPRRTSGADSGTRKEAALHVPRRKTASITSLHAAAAAATTSEAPTFNWAAGTSKLGNSKKHSLSPPRRHTVAVAAPVAAAPAAAAPAASAPPVVADTEDEAPSDWSTNPELFAIGGPSLPPTRKLSVTQHSKNGKGLIPPLRVTESDVLDRSDKHSSDRKARRKTVSIAPSTLDVSENASDGNTRRSKNDASGIDISERSSGNIKHGSGKSSMDVSERSIGSRKHGSGKSSMDISERSKGSRKHGSSKKSSMDGSERSSGSRHSSSSSIKSGMDGSSGGSKKSRRKTLAIGALGKIIDDQPAFDWSAKK